jgi:hypothetical protein
MKFEVLRDMTTKIILFWNVKTCSFIDRILIICPEDGNGRSFQNTNADIPKYIELHPIR